ncbi:helix-turn-helix transcriptional regulator [Flavobacterium sp.]|uniref:helix-turn-helix domain-containing protein n=1 Tax=Flavobacterium sp. TaxID=239 RepID=UPI00262DF4EB|nr:helix-turn-helix transcriptional regulator [Flavobacterium sp.]
MINTDFTIEEFIKKGEITDELELERALIADRKLRLLAKDNLYFKNLRKKLRNLIEAYERKEWSDIGQLTDEKLAESAFWENVAEQERIFMEKRKQQIRKELKIRNLTQQDLGHLLGHKSKTHMSELMNGIKPFTLKDLVLINQLLRIDIKELIPVFLSKEDRIRVQSAMAKLGKPQIKLCS